MSVCLKPFTLKVGGGPTVWFKMEEASGDRIDAVNGIHLPLVSGSPAATQVTGKILKGMNFTQGGTHTPLYQTANNSKLAYLAKGFDMFCWLAVPALSGGQTLYFNDYLIKTGGGADVEEFYMQYLSGTLTLNSINFGVLLTTALPAPLTTFHLVRSYYNPATLKCGVQIDNGAKVEAVYPGGVLPAQALGAVALEAQTGAGDSINISIDEFSLWLASAPSDSVAAQIWKNGNGTSFPIT